MISRLSWSFATHIPTPTSSHFQVLKSKYKDDQSYSFLFSPESANGIYYRWRTYGECAVLNDLKCLTQPVLAFLMGDSLSKWREEPFQMIPGPSSAFWVPPQCNARLLISQKTHSLNFLISAAF
jgi:hypothetical protein